MDYACSCAVLFIEVPEMGVLSLHNTKTRKQQTDEAEEAAKPCSYSTLKM